MDRLVVQFSRRKVLNGFPWLRFVAPNLSGWTDWEAGVDPLLTFLDTTMKPYLGTYNTQGILIDYFSQIDQNNREC